MKRNQFLGINKYSEYVIAEIKDGVIRGFNTGNEYMDAYSETLGLAWASWTHSQTIGSKTFKTGDKLPKSFKPSYKGVNKEFIEPLKKDHMGIDETISCAECGAVEVNSEALYYPDCPIKFYNSLHICDKCVTPDNVMTELNEASDLFRSKNSTGLDLDGYSEVETLFCDSSGFGHSGEAALTKDEALNKAQALIDSNREQLYCALSDIGQFQVYVTIYKKVA